MGRQALWLVVPFAAMVIASPASAAWYLRLHGSAAGYGFSRAGPYQDIGQCQAMAARMGLNADCYYEPEATETPIQNGPTPEEVGRQTREREQQEEARRQEQARRQAEEAERQRRYNADRDAATATLKGGTGTPFFGAGALRGAPPAGVGIRELKPETSIRDLGGPQAAWKELNCAASLSGSAIGALRGRAAPDYDEFSFLTREATNALNGDPIGVQCPAAPPMPKMSQIQLKAKFARLLERIKADAGELKEAQAGRRNGLDRLIEAKRKLLELGVAGATAGAELAGLERQRQSLGPLTIKPAAALPPIQPPSAQTAEEAKRSAMAEALAAARAAKAAYDASTQTEATKAADLDRMNGITGKLEKGDPAAATLLNQMFP